MSTTTQTPKQVRPDESPFEMPALTSGYPLDDAEKAAIAKVLRNRPTDESKASEAPSALQR